MIVYPEEIMTAKIKALEEENKQLKADLNRWQEMFIKNNPIATPGVLKNES
jgi:hypothetical protein